MGTGFVFSVTAGEDIYTADGTLRMKKGVEAERITTGEDGTAVTGPLYPGKYILKEEQPGEYYAASQKVYEVLLEAGEGEEIFQVECEAKNRKTRIEVVKTEAGEAGKTLQGAEFILFEEKQLTQEQIAGTAELATEGGQVLVTDEKGTCTAVNLKHKTIYYLVETKAPEGYAHNGKRYKLAVDEKGLIDGKETCRLEIENYPIVLEVSKKSQESKKELKGAKLTLEEEMVLYRKPGRPERNLML